MWIVLWACAGPPSAAADREAVMAALNALPNDPDRAFLRCAEVRDPIAHADCVTAVVQAAPRHPQAHAWCAGLPQQWHRDECAFVRAEAADDLLGCAGAGPWADECRLHVWRDRVPRLIQAEADFDRALERAREGLLADGLDAGDPALWHPVFWHLLEQGAPVERCEALAGALRVACTEVASERAAR